MHCKDASDKALAYAIMITLNVLELEHRRHPVQDWAPQNMLCPRAFQFAVGVQSVEYGFEREEGVEMVPEGGVPTDS